MSGPGSRDNRRLIVRVLSQEAVGLLTDWARATGGDLLGVLVFTGVWTANVEHLSPRPALRYTEIDDIPSDTLRTPISISDLTERLRLPRATVSVYVRELVANGWLQEVEGGLIAPAHVVARLDNLESLNLAYERALTMIDRLHEAGVPLDPPVGSKPKIGK